MTTLHRLPPHSVSNTPTSPRLERPGARCPDPDQRGGVFSRKPRFVLDALEKSGVSREAVDAAFAADDVEFLARGKSPEGSTPSIGRPGVDKAERERFRSNVPPAEAERERAALNKWMFGDDGKQQRQAGSGPGAVTSAEFNAMSHPERNKFMSSGGRICDQS